LFIGENMNHLANRNAESESDKVALVKLYVEALNSHNLVAYANQDADVVLSNGREELVIPAYQWKEIRDLFYSDLYAHVRWIWA
jgi:hypothetical protein